ncbi:MAG: TRAP transporter substrate-binding protein [Lachnospiraceae bacterium]|nr:TRAP transporter substrate-binding protein [Lachnospiraceae bacterium]MDE6982591.1 TRAP transporter substrate-binding protein [Lachnospiraceae bacterium]
MKRKFAVALATSLALASLAGCGGAPASTSSNADAGADTKTDAPADGGSAVDTSAAELNLIIASNQTSLENPYSYGMDKFKEVVEEKSGGKIAVTVHKGTLGENESELIEKLEMGAANLVVASPGFMTSIGVPEIDIFSLEYLFDSFDHWEKCLDGDFGNKMKEIVTEKTGNNFRIMGYWSSSVRDVYGKKAVAKPDDLKGMTIRTQSSQVQQDFFAACGAIPTSVAWGELYQALQQGVVDSAENDYTNFMLKEHHKTDNGKFVSETHHDYTTRLLLMNGAFYDGLTDEQKGWIDEACVAATAEERQVTYRMFEESKKQVIADGATVTENADIDIEAFKAIANPIMDKFAEENNMTAELEMIRSAAK